MKKRKAESRLSLSINGHTLTGDNRGGAWSFRCDSWPSLARAFSGHDDVAGIVERFVADALAGTPPEDPHAP